MHKSLGPDAMWRPMTIWRKVVGLSDHADDDSLYAHLVRSLFTSKSSLLSANLLGMAVTISAYAITRDNLFLAATLLVTVIGAERTRIVFEVGQKEMELLTRRDYEQLDQRFFLSSLPFSVIIGLVAWRLITYPPSLESHALGAGAAVGYVMGFFARNAGRPKLVIGQVVASAGLLFLGYLLHPVRFGYLYAFLLLGVVVANIYVSISLYKNIVSVYYATAETEILARFDKLTRLANRFTFTNLIADAVEDAPGKPFAVIFLDLDRFKEINDTLGHTAGDAVICEMARRIQECTRGKSQIARFGGDEFLVKFDKGERNTVMAMAKHLNFALRLPYSVGANVIRATASIGVACYPGHGATPEELIKNADIALYEAKRDGGDGSRLFDLEIENKINETRKIETDLRAGIENGEFIPHFQPIYSLQDREIVSFEALARWNHPERGKISPAVFIPIAENMGMIDEIGSQILHQACAAATKWPDTISVAVNVSAKQFRRPAYLFAAVVKALRESGLPASRLNLEVTESILIRDSKSTRDTIEQFILLGVQFSLDDFGTGYSSLSYLKDFPFKKIKIDKSFTDTLATSAASASIIRAVNQIASDLALDVVVEGIETAEQAQFLSDLGVKYGQGYYFSKPLSETKAAHFLPASAGAQGAQILKFAPGATVFR